MKKTAIHNGATKVSYFNPQDQAVKKHLANINSPWKMPLFMMANLPSGVFWGFRIKEVTPEKAIVQMPYSWRTKNPFRSIYFAAQAGAAELSTALPATVAMAGQVPISMLIVGMEAKFVKKASSLVSFVCEEGHKYQECIQQALDSGEGHSATVNSKGVLADGTVVSEFKVTWSFKVKGGK